MISEVQRVLRTQGPLSQPFTVKGAREEGADVRGVSARELTMCEPDSHSPTSLFNILYWCLSLPVSAFSVSLNLSDVAQQNANQLQRHFKGE